MNLISGDCIEEMAKMPPGVINMIFANPPSHSLLKGSEKENLSYFSEWAGVVYRILHRKGSLFFYGRPYWLIKVFPVFQEAGFQLGSWIVWDIFLTRRKPEPLLKTHFGILHLVKQKDFKKFLIRRPHGNCLLEGTSAEDKRHEFGPLVSEVWSDIPGEVLKVWGKKVNYRVSRVLLERLMLMSTEQGDRVLDPFLGNKSTTLIAAKRLARQGIGIAPSQLEVEFVRVKLKKEFVQSHIGGYWVSFDFSNKLRTIRDEDWKGLKKFISPNSYSK